MGPSTPPDSPSPINFPLGLKLLLGRISTLLPTISSGASAGSASIPMPSVPAAPVEVPPEGVKRAWPKTESVNRSAAAIRIAAEKRKYFFIRFSYWGSKQPPLFAIFGFAIGGKQ